MTAALALLRRFWPAIPVLLLALWAARLDQLRAGYRADLLAERSARQLDAANGRAALAKAEGSYATRHAQATATYADRLATREPIILHSTNTVREYAQTAAGRAVCLGADRVRGIDALDASLFAHDPARTDGSEEEVPADPN
ncbi:hypothetical protein SAMN05192583_2925 [Sphingomonas gellani]|uniref:Bacteriophage Rz lysis protein n=1 Tax=Sphingomonas gellani TaxID=1166340 RepID=A0A1H8H4I9_9SPHN|nr:hypothetical protein [Sphingomonas gellani]SEN50920.1 hypothetical protein SAMN05192583_2925 [Sphingomonas gellani]